MDAALVSQKLQAPVSQEASRVAAHPAAAARLPNLEGRVQAVGHRPTVEVGGRLAHIPIVEELSEEPSCVTGIVQIPLHRLVEVELAAALELEHTMVVGITPRKDRSASGAAEWSSGHGILKRFALVLKAGHGLRHRLDAAVRALIVSEDDQDVRTLPRG
jgi:hypothetical protein